MIDIPCIKARYIARRITKCDCVDKLIKEFKSLQDRRHDLIIDYALALSSKHNCTYIVHECEHGCPNAIECFKCLENELIIQPERLNPETS